jgi:hypothetical protein
MPKKNNENSGNKELENMNKDYQKSTGMKVIQQGQPPQGQTNFAINDKNNKK